jgi:hypothetical protein
MSGGRSAMAGSRMGGWHASNWHRAHFFHHGTVRKSPPFLRTSPPQVLLRRSTNLRRRIRLRLLALATDRVGTTPHLGLRRLLLSECAGHFFATC